MAFENVFSEIIRCSINVLTAFGFLYNLWIISNCTKKAWLYSAFKKSMIRLGGRLLKILHMIPYPYAVDLNPTYPTNWEYIQWYMACSESFKICNVVFADLQHYLEPLYVYDTFAQSTKTLRFQYLHTDTFHFSIKTKKGFCGYFYFAWEHPRVKSTWWARDRSNTLK